jgi:hypothetical protein
MSESLSFPIARPEVARERVKLVRGDLVSLDRVALAVKCTHVFEKAAGDFGRQFQWCALDHRSSRAARAKEEEGQALELVESALGCGLRVVEVD